MFEILSLTDHITLKPHEITSNYIKIIQEKILNIYHLKIIPNQGICIQILEIVTSGGHILVGEGDAIFEVSLKALVFIPFKNELLSGTIKACLPEGIICIHVYDKEVSFLGVLEAFVPSHFLFKDTKFQEIEKVWCWQQGKKLRFYDIGEQVKFKIQMTYFDQSYFKNKTNEQMNIFETMIGQMSEPGLGVLRWWE